MIRVPTASFKLLENGVEILGLKRLIQNFLELLIAIQDEGKSIEENTGKE